MIRAAIGFASDYGFNHAQHLALRRDAQHIRAKLLANPPLIAHHLNGLHIKIYSGQITFDAGFVLNGEGYFAIRVVQEGRFLQANLASGPISTQLMHHQQGVVGVDLAAKAIVGEREELALGQSHYAREALHSLTFHGQRAAGCARKFWIAHKRIGFLTAHHFGALAIGRRKFPSGLKKHTRIFRRHHTGGGGHSSVPYQSGFDFCLRPSHATSHRQSCKRSTTHLQTHDVSNQK